MTHTPYHHGDLRAALLDAGDELLREAGLQGFTLRGCARRAGVSHAAPKHHFGDVKGLLTALAERGFQRLADGLVKELDAANGDLALEMVGTARAYTAFAERYPEHFRIMFRQDLVDFNMAAPPPAVLKTFVELTNVIRRQRGECEIEASEMDGEKSTALINDILLGWCFIHGYAHLRLEGQLAMVPAENHDEHLKLAAKRLSQIIQP